jgi:hypothetical protein
VGDPYPLWYVSLLTIDWLHHTCSLWSQAGQLAWNRLDQYRGRLDHVFDAVSHNKNPLKLKVVLPLKMSFMQCINRECASIALLTPSSSHAGKLSGELSDFSSFTSSQRPPVGKLRSGSPPEEWMDGPSETVALSILDAINEQKSLRVGIPRTAFAELASKYAAEKSTAPAAGGEVVLIPGASFASPLDSTRGSVQLNAH